MKRDAKGINNAVAKAAVTRAKQELAKAPPVASPAPKFYGVTEQDLRVVERVMKRLFTEDRMDGNDMRDAAQDLQAFLHIARQMPLPEDGATP